MEFLHGKIYVMEDKKKCVFIFSNTWWEKAESKLIKKQKFPCAKEGIRFKQL